MLYLTANDFITNMYYIKYFYDKFLKIFLIISNYVPLSDSRKLFRVYILLMLFPRIILALLFFIDIFFFNKLFLIYIFITLGLIPLVIKIFIISLERTLGNYILFLEENFKVFVIYDYERAPEVPADKDYFVAPIQLHIDEFDLIEIRYFLLIQCCAMRHDYSLYDYTCVETWNARVKYAQANNIELCPFFTPIPESDEISKILAKDFNKFMPLTLDINVFLISYKIVLEDPRLIKFNIVIMSMYFICWLYILVISFSWENLMQILEILNVIWINIQEPFSDLYVKIEDAVTNIK